MNETAGLVMIVRNEAPILPRLAVSLRDKVSHYTIVDTGSQDNTVEVIPQVFDWCDGIVLHHEFNGFGASRTVALHAAEEYTDWMLHMDADETLHGDLSVSDDTDCMEAEQHNGDLRFWLPRLLRSHRGWESHGRAHEYFASPIARPPMHQHTFWVEHHGDGHGRPNKFQRDIQLLVADWDEEPNARTAFYLARTHEDTGHTGEAIYWYRQRLGLPGWQEETFYARYSLGKCLLDTGAAEEGCGVLWSAWGMSPQRAEPLVVLAEYYRGTEQWQLAYLAAELAFSHANAQPGNRFAKHLGLFVDITATEWRAAFEQSVSAWYVGNKQRGLTLSRYLLERPDIPNNIRAAVTSNLEFYA
jgi:hypothetical protein